MMKNIIQHNQAHKKAEGFFVVGFCIFLVALLLSLYVTFYVYHYKETFNSSQSRRAEILRRKNEETALLNRIAVNNALIIIELSEAFQKYLNHIHATLIYQSTVPFWRVSETSDELSEQGPVESYFSASSAAMSEHLKTAFTLSQDSHEAVQVLERQWSANISLGRPDSLFRITTLADTFCLSLAFADHRKKSLSTVALEALSLQRQSIDGCQARIGIQNIFSPREVLQAASLPKHLEFGLTLLMQDKPICSEVAAEQRQLAKSPVTKILERQHFLNLGSSQVALVHGRMLAKNSSLRSKNRKFQAPCSNSSALHTKSALLDSIHYPLRGLEMMLEPRWAAVYLSSGLGN